MSLGEVPEIQNKACCLLEAWWLGEREGREDVVPNLLLYLIARSLEEKAKVREGRVKRVWQTGSSRKAWSMGGARRCGRYRKIGVCGRQGGGSSYAIAGVATECSMHVSTIGKPVKRARHYQGCTNSSWCDLLEEKH